MSLPDKLFSTYVDLINGLSLILGVRGDRVVDTLSIQDEKTFLVAGGGFCSVFKVEGVMNRHDNETFLIYLQKVKSKLSPLVKVPGLEMSFVFSYGNNTETKAEISAALDPARATARRLGLNLDFLFDEKVETLAQKVKSEYSYLVVYTSIEALDDPEERKEHLKQTKVLSFADNKEKFGETGELLFVKHKSHMKGIKNAFSSADGLRMREMKVKEILHANKKEMSPDLAASYTPYSSLLDKQGLQYFPAVPPVSKPKEIDIESLLGESIVNYVFPETGAINDLRLTQIGDYIHAPMFVKRFQVEPRTFEVLFNELRELGYPYRVAIRMESGKSGKGLESIRDFASSSFATMKSDMSARIASNIKQLHKYENQGDNATVKLSMLIDTWVHRTEHKKMLGNAGQVAQRVQQWGQTPVDLITGEPFYSVSASLIGLTSKRFNLAPRSRAPLDKALLMTPIARPATNWDAGAFLARTDDGKLMPIDFASKKQANWTMCAFGKMGQGKSVLGQAILNSILLTPGASKLPVMVSADIGGSSRGFYNLVKYTLPKERQHQVVVEKLRQTENYAINPFDLPLGLNYPLGTHIDFLNLMIPFFLDNEDDMLEITPVINGIVRQLYINANKEPKTYGPRLDVMVDAAIKKHDLMIDNEPVSEQHDWFEIRDAFMSIGEEYLAIRAQRLAVPRFVDIIKIAANEDFQKQYEIYKTKNGVPLLTKLAAGITEKQDTLPILMNPTKLDVDSATMMSIDLGAVIHKQAATTSQQNENIMHYLLIIYLFQRLAYVDKEWLSEFPPMYRLRYQNLIDLIDVSYKVLQIDEFHRTGGLSIILSYLDVMMREGRKHLIILHLLSQRMSDFIGINKDGKKGINFFAMSSIKCVLGAQPDELDELEKSKKYSKFNLRQIQKIPPPNSENGSFANFGFETKDGMVNQDVVLTLGKAELWLYEYTHANLRLKERVFAACGVIEGVKRLVKYFPECTCETFLEKANMAMANVERMSTLAEEMEQKEMLLVDRIADAVIADNFKPENFLSAKELEMTG